MPRRLSEYALEDWKRLRPLTQGLKTWRYNAVNARHMRRRVPPSDLDPIVRQLAGRRVLITIAFADAQAVEWQARLLRRYVEHDLHLIADNSPDRASADAVRASAERARASYLRLPASAARSSRGHGLALNWVWRHVVRPGEPEAFGFLDDDLFPTAPDDPFAQLAGQDYYGVVRTVGTRWFLWAGFCLFRFAAVRDKPLDFRQDWFIGLDTGGANWEVLYRHADLSRLRLAARTETHEDGGVSERAWRIEWAGGWLHEGGTDLPPELVPGKRAAVAAMLSPHLV